MTSDQIETQRHKNRYFLSVILLGATIILFGSTAYFFRFGLDLTDESFYISWLTGWDKYGGSTSLFGPVLGQVVGNVPLQSMRLIGFFLLTFACILLGLILAKDTSDIASSVSIFSICALGGVAHLGWLPWIPTPNYNSLTMFGLLIFASAFCQFFGVQMPNIAGNSWCVGCNNFHG